MFEPILEAVINGAARYQFNFEQLIVNEKLSYIKNSEMEVISLTVQDGNNPGTKHCYYKLIESNQIRYNKFYLNSKEEVLLPASDADKDEIFNFNLMHEDHSSVLAEKIEKAFVVLNDEYKKLNESVEFDMSAMMKNAGI